tara:strand:- start:5347 stop:5526 length:180 start_codon:yes stop_codon:yes gene_type:complete
MSENPLQKKSQGLGDTVEKIAYIASLGKLTSNPKAGKKDCGCSKRKKALNNKAPYKKEN